MPVAFQRSHLNEIKMITENLNVEIQKLRAIFCADNLNITNWNIFDTDKHTLYELQFSALW